MKDEVKDRSMHIVLLSGGIDSVTMAHFVMKEFGVGGGKNDIASINFSYGSKHNHRERAMARDASKDVGFNEHYEENISLDKLMNYSCLIAKDRDIPEGHYEKENMKDTVVHFRNGIMLSIATYILVSRMDISGIKRGHLWLANHEGDHYIYPDCRGGFIEPMEKSIRMGTERDITIESPFLNKNKSEIVSLGHKMGIDFKKTYTCYNGRRIQCGRCSSCFERREAFHLANVADSTEYEDKTPIEELIRQYKKERS